ncbi:hypothetical protein L1276_003371 [Flavobacterium sp. HSC-32F16]|uniref:hypothetical protein n=1 Tax=Flavobacterium sp. HSC-32F16 TaxID=2910964 RepID=UPI0020A55BD2|nr:hypothetical protein [Flavobacterium sp. HSC-32F16]MCP2028203.1 hypothetical protein [Flavobacterium sp. HSC-32F16]
MHNKLSIDQIVELRNRMRNGTFDSEYEIKTLIRLGYHPDIADLLVSNVVLGFKDEFLNEVKEAKEASDKKEFFRAIMIISSVFNTVLGENNLFLTLIPVALAFVSGYFGFPEKRLLAIAGFVIGAVMMPFLYWSCLQNVEADLVRVIISAFVSFGPAILVKYVVSKLKKESKDL